MPKATTAPWGQISPAFVRRPLEEGGFRFQGSGFRIPAFAGSSVAGRSSCFSFWVFSFQLFVCQSRSPIYHLLSSDPSSGGEMADTYV